MSRPHQGAVLGLRDLLHDRAGFFTQTMALAAVLAPLLLLYSLRVGVVGTLLEELESDPRNRQLLTTRQGHFPNGFIEQLRLDPRVAFVSGHASPIARSLSLSVAEGAVVPQVRGVVLASGPGDPLMPPGAAAPGEREVLLTPSLAERLSVAPGDRVRVEPSRRLDGVEEVLDLTLTITGLTDQAVWDAEGALLAESTLAAIEQWLDGTAIPEFGWHGRDPDAPFAFRNFRLYARNLTDLKSLHADLSRDVPVRAPRLADYEAVVQLNRGLGIVFGVIATSGGLGFLLSFGATLWGNVNRKRHALSVLRLHGLLRRHAALFPVAQAVGIAVAGCILAVAAHAAAALILNVVLSDKLIVSGTVSRLEPAHLAAAFGMTISMALLASLSAAWQVLRIEPGEGINAL
ncbi:MAG: hypothetical protein HQL41_06845 [Alphaproteobacteria bacterium]|nr:hypothetical protein [Alphaproteobacteria bacterium]